MTKTEAIGLFKNASELAAALKVSRSAVSQWPDDGDIPEAAYLKIRYELKPEAFANEAQQSPKRRKAA